MLKWDAGKVVLEDGAEEIPVIKKLYSNDKSKNKKFYNEALTYAYFMYKKGSMYAQSFPKDRAVEVCQIYFGDITYWKKFELNDAFANFKDYYEAIQFDAEERALIALEEEIEDLILHLKDIKYFTEETITVEINIPEYKGSEVMVPTLVKQKVKISNYAEKDKALKAMADVIKTRKLLKEAVKVKGIEKKNVAGKSLLDGRRLK